MRKLASCVVVLSILLMGSFAVTAQGFEPFFEEEDCPFDLDIDITCGYVIVLEDRSDPDGERVELAVVILYALSDNPEPDPVIYLEGGPGGSALFQVEDLAKHPVVETHDLIVFDQRGTGFSWPSLNCIEIEEDLDEDPIAACRDRLLDEGINLNMYNSTQSAADVNDLRIALGYDDVNLWGISYGTKLALTVMRDFPENIRSVVIDSVYPPEIDAMTLIPVSFMDALNALFDRCAADFDCVAYFPDLEDLFYELIILFDDEPLWIETEDGDVEISGEEILAQLFLALYDTARIPYLPYALALLAEIDDEDLVLDGYDILTGAYIPDGDDDDFRASDFMESEFVLDYIDEFGEIDDAEGVYYSVDCSEAYQLSDIDAAYAAAESAPEPLQEHFIIGIETNIQSCEVWGVETADPIENERVHSDVPTLIISGLFDPVTPPSSGDSAAVGLPNSTHIVFPTAGHGISFTDGDAGDCAKQIMMDFLFNPAGPLDVSCVADTDVIEFFVFE
jgi:pimeloyl-ACP methyl ester carboxylesterase